MGIIEGKSIFSGIVFGKPYIERKNQLSVEIYSIILEEVENEIKRVLTAIESSKEDIKKLKENLKNKVNKDDLQILTVHIMLLEDPQYISDIKRLIKKDKINAEAVIQKVSDRYIEMFEKIGDPIYKQRALDIKDISDRVIRKLMDMESFGSELNDRILITKELYPSELLKLYYDGIDLKGIIMEYAGETSHIAILAKTLEIPTLMGGENLLSTEWGEEIILDTTSIYGRVIISPTEKDLKEYEEKRKAHILKLKEIEETNSKEAITLDGKNVNLYVNMGSRFDIEQIKMKNPVGVGLLRTELIYMEAEQFPTEEFQKEIYERIASGIGDEKSILIRTLDIGADKKLPYYQMKEEENPSLGCRGIRFTLENKDVFKTQLKAILQAGKNRDIKIMYPMVTTIDEIIRAKDILEECKQELRDSKKEFKEEIEVGMMVEVPSNIVLAEMFADYVDFFSIGTNDLTQYILATDRYNQIAEMLYDCYDPSVIRAIYKVVKAGKKKGKKVSVCGEMAGEELGAIMLLALDVTHLSMSPAYIPRVRNLVRKIDSQELEEVKKEVFKAKNSKEIKEILNNYLNKIERRKI